jgi:hypothetical protein
MMKDNLSSQGKPDMTKKKNLDLQRRIEAADPANSQKTPEISGLVFSRITSGEKLKAKPPMRNKALVLSLASSALIVLLISSNLQINFTNSTKTLPSESLVLDSNSNRTGSMGPMWREGQVAAEYNYHLSGSAELSRENYPSEAFLIIPESNLQTRGEKLAIALGITNPQIKINMSADGNTYMRFSGSNENGTLQLSSTGNWYFSNPTAKNQYGTVVHTNHVCMSPMFGSCSNSWKDVLDLPTSSEARKLAMPILLAGGYKGPDTKITTTSFTEGVLKGYTDFVGYQDEECSLYEESLHSCVIADPEDVANYSYAGFSVRFASGSQISHAQGSFFTRISIGEFETKSAQDAISFLSDYHQGVGWLLSPVDPPAASKRIDLNWTIVTSGSGYSVWKGLDREGKTATFILPTVSYKLKAKGNEDPFLLTFPAVGNSMDSQYPGSNKSNYRLSGENSICIVEAFGLCF